MIEEITTHYGVRKYARDMYHFEPYNEVYVGVAYRCTECGEIMLTKSLLEPHECKDQSLQINTIPEFKEDYNEKISDDTFISTYTIR